MHERTKLFRTIPKHKRIVLYFQIVQTSQETQTLSCNHCIQRAPSLSSKNPTPNWLANKGIYSIIARRTLQCLSSASSTMAGNKDCDSRSIPITCKNIFVRHRWKQKENEANTIELHVQYDHWQQTWCYHLKEYKHCQKW